MENDPYFVQFNKFWARLHRISTDSYLTVNFKSTCPEYNDVYLEAEYPDWDVIYVTDFNPDE